MVTDVPAAAAAAAARRSSSPSGHHPSSSCRSAGVDPGVPIQEARVRLHLQEKVEKAGAEEAKEGGEALRGTGV